MNKIILAALALLTLASCTVNMKPSNGEKIGHIVKLADEGLVCKTHEGQLVRGGLSGGSGSVGGAPFEFTIPDSNKELLEAAKAALEENREVIISYETSFIASTCSQGSGNHFVTKIVPAEKPAVLPSATPAPTL